ncbi:pantoate--beta-alanine ligase [Flavobacteriaceae bacterium]|jgi:pantoate--beta-alanine ligase|nr:pantoate--beta-alanine ligase [Flavobacteriaceae bacterium]MDC1492376.1 pantoate--beta-alanine ligase [Flavobacteriaceae bacterium]
MNIFHKKSDLIPHLNHLRASGLSIGFVPTMGALHDGHISLINQSLSDNKISVVSIFINPTQFNNSSDLTTYPKDLSKDYELLKTISDEILVFAPEPNEIYTDKIIANSYDFNGLDKFMEGKFRKNHFRGVATVVELLLDIVKPNSAYFGEKDYQQLKIIKSLKTNVNIVGCTTLRDTNGLALSSRNSKLNSESRLVASNIFQNLNYVKFNFNKLSIENLTTNITNKINSFDQMELEYFVIADEDKLTPADEIKFKKKYRAFISVFVDGIRLIDNIALN